MKSDLADRLLHWYDQHRRQLPWRDNPDPYAVWVSEIMLQQTRVETVIPYYDRWLTQFPTIADLAAASQQDVLKLWEGLGYYSRTRNLHRAAQQVVKDFGGQLPNQVKELRQLAGIGRYTAGAIASICFHLDEPTLDGNIRRVFSRLFNVTETLGSTQSDRLLWELARTHLPTGWAGDYNQAWMDLGATICTPRSLQCEICPMRSDCQAYGLGIQSDRPVLKTRKEIPQRSAVAAIIRTENEVLLVQRQEKGLLGGLWEFPNDYVEIAIAPNPTDLHNANLSKLLEQFLIGKLGNELTKEWNLETHASKSFGVYSHAYTHFRVKLYAYIYYLPSRKLLEQSDEPSKIHWVPITDLAIYPMGKLARQIARKLQLETAPIENLSGCD